MIADKLENIGRYACLGKNFAEAARFISSTDISSLPMGKHEIDGSSVFCMKQENVLSKGEPAWEAHEKYADIQIIIDGCERFNVGFSAKYNPLLPDSDFRTCYDVSGMDFILESGQFALFLPDEPHAPGLWGGKDDKCVKLVVKVLA